MQKHAEEYRARDQQKGHHRPKSMDQRPKSTEAEREPQSRDPLPGESLSSDTLPAGPHPTGPHTGESHTESTSGSPGVSQESGGEGKGQGGGSEDSGPEASPSNSDEEEEEEEKDKEPYGLNRDSVGSSQATVSLHPSL